MTDTKEFIKLATIRPVAEILDLSDLIYRIHWALRNVELNNLPPMDVNSSIVFERHYAINWVIDSSISWGNITTDT